jgi:3-dehydroquinate synthase
MSAHVVDVPCASKDYQVHVGRGLVDEVGPIVGSLLGTPECCIVSDDTVDALYGDRVQSSLAGAGIEAPRITFPAGERNKRLATLETILERIASHEMDRKGVVVAVGGGVTGDMGGLAAALYLRGCRLVQVPTSLLAMVDSSVGGKTAVDLAAGKNLCGAFLQPEVVIADVETLSTLPASQLTDGCGEVIKHGVLADEVLFERLAASPINSAGHDLDELADVVARNVEIKRDVVAADEREQGVRQMLNLGHTIGHAIEAASGFALGHGASVAVGLCCIARASAAEGWCAADVPGRIEACVAAYGLPTDTDIDHDTLMGYLAHDKKRSAAGYSVVIPRRIGEVELRRVSPEAMRSLVDAGCGTSR